MQWVTFCIKLKWVIFHQYKDKQDLQSNVFRFTYSNCKLMRLANTLSERNWIAFEDKSLYQHKNHSALSETITDTFWIELLYYVLFCSYKYLKVFFTVNNKTINIIISNFLNKRVSNLNEIELDILPS